MPAGRPNIPTLYHGPLSINVASSGFNLPRLAHGPLPEEPRSRLNTPPPYRRERIRRGDPPSRPNFHSPPGTAHRHR